MADEPVLLVVQKNDHSLGYYGLESGRELDRVRLDPYPHEFALSAGGKTAFICHFGVALAEDAGPGGHTVSVVDIPARRRAGTLDCGRFRRPHGIDLDAKGAVYAVSEGASRLLIARDPAAGRFEGDQPTGGAGSHWVTVTRDGRLAFVSNMVSNSVTVLFPREPVRDPVVLPVGERPEGSVLDAAERRLYVVCRESSRIEVIDVARLAPLEPIATRPGPVRICRDDTGRLLVALYHDRGLAVIDPARPGEQHYTALPDKPVSVSFHGGSGAVLLSTLGDEVCVVSLGQGKLDRRIATRAGPDPTAVVPPWQDREFDEAGGQGADTRAKMPGRGP